MTSKAARFATSGMAGLTLSAMKDTMFNTKVKCMAKGVKRGVIGSDDALGG